MRLRKRVAILWMGLLAATSAAGVTTTDQEWHDAARKCDVPVRLYQPDAKGPAPVIIFSHGLGGSRRGYSYLGDYWASHGYFCVFPQHVGSDESIIATRGIRDLAVNMRKAVSDPQNLINRPKDVSFVIDQLERMNAAGAFKGRLDLKHIGVAGHSFGAYTTLAIAGQRFGIGDREVTFADPRVTCAIAMSEQPPKDRGGERLDRIQIPMLHMTGTRDTSPFGDVEPRDRRNVYDLVTPNADQYLIILDGATHMTFGGVGPATRAPRQQLNPMHEIILKATTRFWDAYLKDSASAELRKEGFTPMIRKDDVAQKKLASP